MKNKKLLEVFVISAHELPSYGQGGITRDIIDPYVVISIHGVPDDRQEKKTTVVQNNGFNPAWNQRFQFTVNCPELAFVRFEVVDDDPGLDDDIGEYTIRFENIREGRGFLFF